jgi:hypothetical protein
VRQIDRQGALRQTLANRIALVDGNAFAWLEMPRKDDHDAKHKRETLKLAGVPPQAVVPGLLQPAERGPRYRQGGLEWVS